MSIFDRPHSVPPPHAPNRWAVACVMLSPARGGLEQTLVDNCEALDLTNHRVVAVVHPSSPYRRQLNALSIEQVPLSSMNEWDPLSAFRLWRILWRIDPALVLSIGRRAGRLACHAMGSPSRLPHIAQTHNYSLKYLIGLTHVIVQTEDLSEALIAAGHPHTRVSVIPHLVRCPKDIKPPLGRKGVPVIGALGRFVAKKGFDDLIRAFAILRDRGYRFSALLGGTGPEQAALHELSRHLGLEDRITFLGWVDDHRAFFSNLDFFCVPSHHEPFGLVVLEGLAHGIPMVVTDSEGPSQIITDRFDGLIVPKKNAERLAEALAQLLDDPAKRFALAEAGLETVRTKYELSVIAERLEATIDRSIAENAGSPDEAPGHRQFLSF